MGTGYQKRRTQQQGPPPVRLPKFRPSAGERAKAMVSRGLPIQHIINVTGLSRREVSAVMRDYVREKRDDPAETDEMAKQRQIAALENIEAAFTQESERTGSARPLKWAMQAMGEQRKIRGLDAPSKSLSVSVEATASGDRNLDLNRSLFHEDPAAIEHILALKAIQRSRGIAGGDGRRGLGHQDQPGGGTLDTVAAPGGDQPPADEGRLGPVPQTDDLRAPEAR
jgi:hypothetical protein